MVGPVVEIPVASTIKKKQIMGEICVYMCIQTM